MTKPTKIALNIADLTRYDEIIRAYMIAPIIQGREMVEAERNRIDGSAVVTQCDATRALAVVHMLRLIDTKARRYPLRAYQSGARGSWTRIANTAQGAL